MLAQYPSGSTSTSLAVKSVSGALLLAYRVTETGPVIAQYEVELEAGLRLAKITGLADDLAIALRSSQQTGLVEEESSPGSLPTKKSGAVAAEKPAASVTGHSSMAAQQQTVVDAAASSEPVTKQSSAGEPELETEPEAAEENAISENVDDLLAVVEAMRAKSTSLRARMTVPSAEEMQLRKEQLRETVGRILATL